MKFIKIFIIVSILALSLYIRFHNYSVYPQRGATSDEYSYSFLGVSLLTKHEPISWSSFQTYKDVQHLTIEKIYFPIVHPYFDHPPLNGLVVGGWALLFGENTFEKISLETIRIVPIILGLISSLLVLLIGRKAYGFKTGIWALLIFTTVTTFVMNMRVVVAENLLTVIFLTALYLFLKFEKRMKTKHTIILGILCGLGLLTKILGVVIFLTILYLFLLRRLPKKQLLVLIGIFTVFLLILLGYGAYYDFDLFLQVQFAQSGRDIGPQTLWLITLSPTIVNYVYYDAWYFLGIFALLYSFSSIKRNAIIVIPALIYLLLLVFSLTQHGHSGWYLIPLFPFMSLAIAQMLVEGLEKKNFLYLVLLFFIGVIQIPSAYEQAFGLVGMQYRILLLIMFTPLLISFLFKNDRLYKFLGNSWFYLLIFNTALNTLNYIHPV
ncbi:MAG: glycosyltransferase family 39 protein [Candidatus Levybacteria bacterium]|nr:glycosyltransferase family 39 protein [Candidatus Levybacteria bacterium]